MRTYYVLISPFGRVNIFEFVHGDKVCDEAWNLSNRNVIEVFVIDLQSKLNPTVYNLYLFCKNNS